jgi:hypothetical protein
MTGIACSLAITALVAAIVASMTGASRTSFTRILIAGCLSVTFGLAYWAYRPPGFVGQSGALPESLPENSASADARSEAVRSQVPVQRAADKASFDTAQLNSFSTIDAETAVYDIAAHTVYLPNGVQLEAHSGLGERLDDPRYVHEHMRGATPPSVYELTFREKPFHGVRALRLVPVGAGNIFGRKGLLAHTYMLGPKGDSNGCVVFKDYKSFLQAFEAGEVKRLLVVAHLDN